MAAAAIHIAVGGLALDCFAWLAMTMHGISPQTEKDVPQPQDAVAFGFLILNEAPMRSST